MAFIHGKDTLVLGDEIALTGYLSQAQVSKSAQVVSVDTFGSSDKAYIAGIEEGTLSINGLFDADANASDAELHGALGAAAGKLITVGYGGLTIGNKASIIQGRESNYSIQGTSQDAVRVSATFTGDGPVRNGVSLHDLTAETSTGNFASVDNGASSANGAVAHLHVTAFTGTSATIKITDSADDAAFADHITFASVTGVTQERATSTGTVDRYARVELTGTFTSITFAVVFARNLH